MIKTIREWLSGWAATLHIMIFNRDTYRMLRDWTDDDVFDEDDFTEADRPGGE